MSQHRIIHAIRFSATVYLYDRDHHGNWGNYNKEKEIFKNKEMFSNKLQEIKSRG